MQAQILNRRIAEIFFERLTRWLAILGGLGLLFAILVTCISIILKATRRSLDFLFSSASDPAAWSFIRPILGEEELVQYAVGVALFTALPWCMLNRGHVRIDVFEPLFGQRLNRILDFIADASLSFVAFLILTRQWGLLIKQPRRSEDSMIELIFSGNWEVLWTWVRTRPETQILGIKEWPFFMFAEFCIAVFLVVGLYCCAQSLVRVFDDPTPHRAPGEGQ